MKTWLALLCGTAIWLAGCTSDIPYRPGKLAADPACKQVYAEYDKHHASGLTGQSLDASNPCWRRPLEEHDVYDLLFVEFDDQGWVQHASSSGDFSAPDHLSAFFKELERMLDAQKKRSEEHGLSLVVYVHGWHHNASGADEDVRAFRSFLRQAAIMERKLKAEEPRYLPMHVVGIYVGWRGESVSVPALRKVTFWERKSTAERVAQGSVRELLKWLDLFRDAKRSLKGVRNVRMLTIGHSFGGLITFEALSSEFLRNSVRFRQADRWMSRVGDLVIIANPAFEGARYEPLRAAGVRLHRLESNQLPVLIVATSEADWATRVAFPAARLISTLFESKPGEQWQATVKTIGHNERYTTHELGLGDCKGDESACKNACKSPPAPPTKSSDERMESAIEHEYRFMQRIEQQGVSGKEFLCGGLELKSTSKWVPDKNPFWVVRTTDKIMGGHGDIFNENFVAFMRQMYLGFIFARAREQRESGR